MGPEALAALGNIEANEDELTPFEIAGLNQT